MSDAEIDYIELPATDLGATKDFYAQAFGWEWVDYGPTYATSSGAQIKVALNAEARVGALQDAGAQNAVGPFILFGTSDLEAVEAAVTTAGAEIVTPVYPYPGGRRFHFSDPSGNVLGVYQPDT